MMIIRIRQRFNKKRSYYHISKSDANQNLFVIVNDFNYDC